MDLRPLTAYAMFLAARKKNKVGPIGLHHLLHVGNAHRHRGPVARRNFCQFRRCIETTRPNLSNLQSSLRPVMHDIQHSPETIRPIFFRQTPLQP